jgi:peptide deformylase
MTCVDFIETYNQYEMPVREILRLGNPGLFHVCDSVTREELDEMGSVAMDLHDTIMDFRNRTGMARAMASPQIGVYKRMIYMHIERPVVFINPVLSDLSADMIEMWDDCMSFPELLVRLRRHKTCRITYRDMEWNEHTKELTELSELLQHEVDHLDGVLAVSRAIDDRSIVLRSERHFLDGQVANE